jgi:hypothetical protein
MNGDSVIAALPMDAAIGARMYRAEENPGKNYTALRLEDDRTDVQAAKRAPGFAPLSSVGALE